MTDKNIIPNKTKKKKKKKKEKRKKKKKEKKRKEEIRLDVQHKTQRMWTK
jgi:hypothetical protein